MRHLGRTDPTPAECVCERPEVFHRWILGGPGPGECLKCRRPRLTPEP